MPLTLRRRGNVWHARGTVPMRQEDGKISHVRIEESTREESKARATRFAQDLWDYYQEQAYRPKPKVITFEDAAITFVESKQSSKRDRQFLTKLIEHFWETPISQIDQGAMANACSVLYPGAKASTLHRAVYAPVISVLRLSGVVPKFEKPKVQKAHVDIPPQDWFEKVLPHCDDQLKAYLLFISITGRRPTEALEAEVDGNHAIIKRSKTGRAIRVPIPTPCLDLLGERTAGKLFTYGDRHNVYRVLKRACRVAGTEMYGLHAIGRHSAATRLLKAGYSTKFVADALGWASTRMVDEHYGHLAKDEVAEEAYKVGEEWLRNPKA